LPAIFSTQMKAVARNAGRHVALVGETDDNRSTRHCNFAIDAGTTQILRRQGLYRLRQDGDPRPPNKTSCETNELSWVCARARRAPTGRPWRTCGIGRCNAAHGDRDCSTELLDKKRANLAVGPLLLLLCAISLSLVALLDELFSISFSWRHRSGRPFRA
jgi:hypothetical protein